MLDSKTYHFSKANQLYAIKQIIRDYPTAKDFKQQLLKSGNPKIRSMAQSINENMDRYQYIDFLQYVFVKYSGYGKFLSTILSAIGLGIIGNYLGLYQAVNKSKLVSDALDTAVQAGKGNTDALIDNAPDLIHKFQIDKAVGGGMLSGALAGGIGGGIVNGIWNWNDNNKQKEIEDLKADQLNGDTLNHVMMKRQFRKFK